MVAGISRMELAKIGGITPEVLIFSGMCVAIAAEHAAADLALGILDEDAALRALHEHDEGDDQHRQHEEDEDEERRQRAGAAQLQQIGEAHSAGWRRCRP